VYGTYSADSALPTAVHWVEALFLGNLGTAIAVLGVALLGLGMLQGRLSLRAAGRVILGIFILFGAPSLVRELMDSTRNNAAETSVGVAPAPPPPPRMPVPPPTNSDPYAGAAVPQ